MMASPSRDKYIGGQQLAVCSKLSAYKNWANTLESLSDDQQEMEVARVRTDNTLVRVRALG